jgi:simple sugar transport system ATP-binding protein
MSEALPFLSLRALSKTFGGAKALDRIDWEVAAGEVHCLVGENGCGKSTLIKTVTGVHEPDPGSAIEIAGKSYASLTPSLAKSLGIQVIYQDLSLFPNLSVAENIAIDENLRGVARRVRYGRMREIAQGLLSELGFALPLDLPVSSLPISERQVVAICRGLAAKARLLFMDEPTASLTRSEVSALLGIVAGLKARGITIVFVSHKLDEVVEIADRVTVLRDAKKVGTYAAADVDARRIGELMTGRLFDHAIAARDMSDAAPLLEVRDLTRKGEYEGITFTIGKGEAVGIAGLLGAGRTELALSLFGMTLPDAGEIRFGGRPLKLSANRDAIAAGIAYVSEDRLNVGLNMKQSIADNLTLAVLPRLANKAGLIPSGRRRKVVEAGIAQLKIKTGGSELPVSTLSGGNQQRVVLAKWLATDPSLLILDGPTVGVDIGNKHAIYEIIRGLAGRGVGLLIISDEIPELFATCDRVLHMKDGRLAGEYRPGRDSEEMIEEKVYA